MGTTDVAPGGSSNSTSSNTYRSSKMAVWSLDNPVFITYVFYSTVLAAKMILMGPLTGYFRITRKAFVNPEDVKSFGLKETKTDVDVERVRRAHQNDLENIPIFWLLGLLFVLTSPSLFAAKVVFRVYTAARILHTLLYLKGSGIRGTAYFVGILTKIYMVATILYTFW
ncbi:microsomal glutathione S-transferase 1-like isoform X2 [Panulirus ornatus]|uniref:microsomal glutathione S-transferase 1-like isoform X2 n=1 Tax=Panulirus ornatus TaxID=150431 RepID=UPI003A8C3E05